MKNTPSKLGILGALALSACASVPAVQKPQNFPHMDPENVGMSGEVARAVFDVMVNEPTPVSCAQC
jgi:hypothetical protein